MRSRFRVTELPARYKSATLGAAVLLCLSAGPAAGCATTTGGTAVGPGGTASSTAPSAPLSDPAEPVPGVEATLPDHIPPNALVCFPSPTGNGRLTTAVVSDPVAPKITIALPEGWDSAPGTGDVALRSTGPDGMSVRVTISPTDLDPGGAFLRYAAELRTSDPGVKVSVAAAQFCGYSSQLLSGTGGAVAFADRVTHIWTNTKAYLVVVHLEGPAGAPGFGTAESTVMRQFAIAIP